jgi:hypothetical protein
MIEQQQISKRITKTNLACMSSAFMRLVCCCLAAATLFVAGCGQDTRNTFSTALDDCSKGGDVVLQKDKSGGSGYAILGDAQNPKSKIALALLSISHDEFYLGPDTNRNVWASVIVFEFTLENKILSGTGVRSDRGIRSLTPVKEIFKVWEPKWNDYLRAHEFSLPEAEKTRMDAMLNFTLKRSL